MRKVERALQSLPQTPDDYAWLLTRQIERVTNHARAMASFAESLSRTCRPRENNETAAERPLFAQPGETRRLVDDP
jgi:hypothetical protein